MKYYILLNIGYAMVLTIEKAEYRPHAVKCYTQTVVAHV